jgi:hypothetical protein
MKLHLCEKQISYRRSHDGIKLMGKVVRCFWILLVKPTFLPTPSLGPSVVHGLHMYFSFAVLYIVTEQVLWALSKTFPAKS